MHDLTVLEGDDGASGSVAGPGLAAQATPRKEGEEAAIRHSNVSGASVDDYPRHDAEELERQREDEAARARGAAMEQMENIPCGQAFATIRGLKKQATLVSASEAAAENVACATSADPAPATSTLLPPPGSFSPALPAPSTPAPPAAAAAATAAALAPNQAAAAAAGQAAGAADALLPPAAAAAAAEPAQRPGKKKVVSPAVAAARARRLIQQGLHQDSGMHAKHRDSLSLVGSMDLQAAWRFAEMTPDGGVALSFSALEGMSGSCSNLEMLYEALGQVEEEALEDASSLEMMPSEENAGTSGECASYPPDPVGTLLDMMLPPSKLAGSAEAGAAGAAGRAETADCASGEPLSQQQQAPQFLGSGSTAGTVSAALHPAGHRADGGDGDGDAAGTGTGSSGRRPDRNASSGCASPFSSHKQLHHPAAADSLPPVRGTAGRAAAGSSSSAASGPNSGCSAPLTLPPISGSPQSPAGSLVQRAGAHDSPLASKPPSLALRPSANTVDPFRGDMMRKAQADAANTIRSELQRSLKPVRHSGDPGSCQVSQHPRIPDPAGSIKPGSRSSAADPAGSGALDPGSARSKPPSTATAASARSSVQRHESIRQSLQESAKAMELSIRVGFLEGKIKPINIVMLVVGTRGDVQPFIGIGLRLKEYGHRVRLASHKVYREFVTGFGLEFYPLGGDPKVLSEFVVKHRGIMPGLNISDALEQREQVKQILYSSWGACVLPDPERPEKLFIADAIVANPPAYGHTHCAEKLNVPLHIVFTMPWTPTKQFPNPFARIKTVIGGSNSRAREVMNWLSYFAVEDLAWIGMSGMVKDFRRRTLQLNDYEGKDNGSHAIYHSKVPITYIWSPSLVERPCDWPPNCEVVGFINVELQKLTKYTPPKELQEFLDAGPPPVYIGFGSLVVDDPEKLTRSFLEAIKSTGLRAIIQKGWGGLGAGVQGDVQDVLFIGAAPHDWLFQQCSAVVHHGGAGTTACGLYCGKPTFIVPFFGDQPFWGAAVHKAGAGPPPVAIDDLTTDRIVDALKTLVMPSCQKAAKAMQERMTAEKGIDSTVDHLHRTIYGALLGGRTFKWMKRGASRSRVIASTIFEGAEEGGISGLVGRIKSIFTKSEAPSRMATREDSDGLVSPSGTPEPPRSADSVDSCVHVNASTGCVIPRDLVASPKRAPAGFPSRQKSGGGGSAPGTPKRAAQEVEEGSCRHGRLFSFVGC